MFCKWCGGTLAPSDTKCKRCGREVPALSDCGGFYDLVPGARRTETIQSRTPQPAPIQPVLVAQPERKIKRIRLPLILFVLVVVVFLVIAFLVTVFVFGKVKGARKPAVTQTSVTENVEKQIASSASQTVSSESQAASTDKHKA